MRVCSICLVAEVFSEKVYRCRSCHNAANRKWRAEHQERARELGRAQAKRSYRRYADIRRAKSKEPAAAEALRLRAHAWKQRNRENLNARRAARYAADAVFRASRLAAQGKRRQQCREGDLTGNALLALLELYGHRCAYCGADAEHIDHVSPLASGGSHTRENVVPACAPCNFSKGSKSVAEWLGTPTSDILLCMGTAFAPLNDAINFQPGAI